VLDYVVMRSAIRCLMALLFLAAQAPYFSPAGASTKGCSSMPCCVSGKRCVASTSCPSHAAGATGAGFCFRASACSHQAPGAVIPNLDPASIGTAVSFAAVSNSESLPRSTPPVQPSFIRDPISPPPRA
jgi:hypothetical protein